MKRINFIRTTIGLLALVAVLCLTSSNSKAQYIGLTCPMTCPNTVNPIEPILPIPWVSSTGWLGPVWGSFYHGSCYVEYCYCWRKLTDNTGKTFYQATLCGFQVSSSSSTGPCADIQTIMDEVIDHLQNTAKTNIPAEYGPCIYPAITVETYKPVCWKWHQQEDSPGHWSGANGYWTSCNDPARCKLAISMCEDVLGQITKTQISSQIIGTPECETIFDYENFDPDAVLAPDDDHNPNHHVTECYRIDCANNPPSGR